ncbi:hypothetical protein GOODEAATRI_034366, partial [Goodea atripinnis]
MAGRRLQFTPETPRGNVPPQPASASPAIDERTLITAMNRLSLQMTQFSTEVIQQLAQIRDDLATCNERLRVQGLVFRRAAEEKVPKEPENCAATTHDK